jgi:hypothetical protein
VLFVCKYDIIRESYSHPWKTLGQLHFWGILNKAVDQSF